MVLDDVPGVVLDVVPGVVLDVVPGVLGVVPEVVLLLSESFSDIN